MSRLRMTVSKQRSASLMSRYGKGMIETGIGMSRLRMSESDPQNLEHRRTACQQYGASSARGAEVILDEQWCVAFAHALLVRIDADTGCRHDEDQTSAYLLIASATACRVCACPSSQKHDAADV